MALPPAPAAVVRAFDRNRFAFQLAGAEPRQFVVVAFVLKPVNTEYICNCLGLPAGSVVNYTWVYDYLCVHWTLYAEIERVLQFLVSSGTYVKVKGHPGYIYLPNTRVKLRVSAREPEVSLPIDVDTIARQHRMGKYAPWMTR